MSLATKTFEPETTGVADAKPVIADSERSIYEGAGEQRYRSLLTAIAQVVWTTDGAGRVTDSMPQWCELTGQTGAEVNGFGWLNAIHEDDRQRAAEIWHLAVETRAPYRSEYRIRRANGEYGHFVSRGTPILDPDGEIHQWVGICEDITARKEAETQRDQLLERERQALNEIQASESRYRQLADAMPQIVWTAMTDGRVDYYNQQWTDYTGRSFAESSGWTWLEALHPDDRQVCVQIWSESAKNGEAYQVECRIKRAADDTYRWHLARATPMRDSDGAVIKWFGTATDIDDQKLVEAELERVRDQLEVHVAERTAELVRVNYGLRVEIEERQQSEAERRVLFEIIQGVTTTSNLQELLQLIHRSIAKVVYAENFFVALRDPVTGMIHMEFFVDRFDAIPPPQKLGRGRTAYLLRKGRPLLMTTEEAEQLTADGEIDPQGTPPASWLGIPLGTPNGAIGALVVQSYDDPGAFSSRDLSLMTSVGSQIAFAIERKQVEERLRESEEKYRTILDALDDGYFEVDLRGNYVFVNDAFCRITGYPCDEMTGHSYREFFNGPLVRQLRDAYHAVYTTGSTLKSFEYELITRLGETRSIEESVSLKRNAEGEPVGFIGIRRDRSQRKRAERELEEARNVAVESARLKSEFLANMSHEIRTPMNGVIGMTGLLLNSNLSNNQRDFVETIRASGESLLTIINDILDFSKIEARMLHFEELDFDLDNLVEGTIEVFAESARKKKLELASLVHGDVPLGLRGDPGRLRQVLTNLIGNALKFTETGEVVVQAEKESETADSVTVRFTVSDTGIGIAEPARRRLFEAFTQADGSTTRKYGGTGLGLAISKQLVGLMGGNIGVISRFGDGSKFWFTACFARRSDDVAAELPAPVPQLEGIRVLIVDDNTTNRIILGHQLSSRGVKFVEAESGPRALEILQRDPAFDLAILDLMMPGMDGFELARQIKSNRQMAAVKLMLLTSFVAAGQEPSANRDDIAAYLTKPVRQTQLFDCLSGLIARADSGNPRRKSVSGESFVAKVNPNLLPPGKRILLAEDNVINQKVATLQLKKLGLTADTVKNGREALEAMLRMPYDLVLMDCQMPEMDGYEATAAIRRREGTKHRTPVVAMTANALEGDRAKCLAAGMDDYVSKPVNIEELGKTLKRFLSQ